MQVLKGSTGTDGTHSSPTSESPDNWTRSQIEWVAARVRKLNFPEDFLPKSIHGSDSGCPKCPQGRSVHRSRFDQ